MCLSIKTISLFLYVSTSISLTEENKDSNRNAYAINELKKERKKEKEKRRNLFYLGADRLKKKMQSCYFPATSCLTPKKKKPWKCVALCGCHNNINYSRILPHFSRQAASPCSDVCSGAGCGETGLLWMS